MGVCLFFQATWDRTRGFSLKGSCRLGINENSFTKRMVKHWHRLPRVVGESLEIFKKCVDGTLEEMNDWWPCVGHWKEWCLKTFWDTCGQGQVGQCPGLYTPAWQWLLIHGTQDTMPYTQALEHLSQFLRGQIIRSPTWGKDWGAF